MFISKISSRNKFHLAILSTAIFCWPISSTSAIAQTSQPTNPIRSAYQTQYGDRFDTNSLTKYLNLLFSDVDIDKNGVSLAEISLHRQIQNAAKRARIAAQVLTHDLNGDTIVTRAEIQKVVEVRYARNRRLNEHRYKALIETAVEKALAGDPNKDGRLEPAEYDALSKHARYAKYFTYFTTKNHSTVATALLKVDPNNDGIITQVEAMGILSKAFDGVKITPPARSVHQPKPSCKAPKAPKNAHVAVVGAYEGSSVPTVTIAGQDGETSTTKITIEKGEKPIYLLVTSYSAMIWRLHGATNRLSHVIVAGPLSKKATILAGVIGVAKDKVHFLSARNCFNNFYKLKGIKGAQAKSQAKSLVGKNPDTLTGHYTLHQLQLPSGKHTKTKRTSMGGVLTIIKADTKMEISTKNNNPTVKIIAQATSNRSLKRNLLRYNPGGIVKINAKLVVSPSKPEDYMVLPQESGLLQHVTSGVLEVISRREFKIVKKMKFPAGLSGAHGKRFLLKKGVPEPTGHPGHSCVFSEDKDKFIIGHCR